MRLLLAHGADANITTFHGTTALAAAAGVNWTVAQTVDAGPEALLEAVRICHEAGNDVNAANSKGIRAIHGAANRGSVAILRFLAGHGADLVARDSEGRTPLDWANGVFLATHPAVPRPEAIALLEALLADAPPATD
jgi:ankyrin repeat protein